MKPDYYLTSDTAKKIYAAIADLPICDYHCHLSPREIYEDKPFDNLGEIWLAGDHYKWRLMRCAGVDESLVTGKDTSWHDKYLAYVGALYGAVGNPLPVWSEEELRLGFGIDLPLTPENAEEIWRLAGEFIRREKLSPRGLIRRFGVTFIATTDDPADTLEWHEKIAADETFGVTVAPSFRPDKALSFRSPDYLSYLKKLAEAVGYPIDSFDSFCRALSDRLDFFTAHGCKVADVGLSDFPARVAKEAEAALAFSAVLSGDPITDSQYEGLLGFCFVKLASLYRKSGILSQWHLSAIRNPNASLFRAIGPDAGCDAVGHPVNETALARLLNACAENGGLPKTVLYTLNPSATDALCSIAGSFPGVSVGAAWWFVDHREGILSTMKSVAAVGHLGSFRGMLTDSRSFLSYVRHDYFRRLLALYLASLSECGEVTDTDRLCAVAKDISYGNIAREMGVSEK